MAPLATSEQAHVSLRLPAEIVETLDRIAAIIDRPRSWVMVRALRQYLDTEGAQLIEDAESLGALDRGEGIPAEEVLTELDKLLDPAPPRSQR